MISLTRDSVKESCTQLLLAQRTSSKVFVEENKEPLSVRRQWNCWSSSRARVFVCMVQPLLVCKSL